MGLLCITVGYTPSVVNQGARTVLYRLDGEYHESGTIPVVYVDIDYGLGALLDSSIGGFGVSNEYDLAFNSWQPSPANTKPVLICDRTYGFRATAFDETFGAKRATVLSFKSYAITPTASAPTSSAILSDSATISCTSFFPNTDESTATVKMQYRAFGSPTWLDAPGGTTDYTGYLTQSISRNLGGLSSGTTYEFRLSMSRTTSNETSFTSSVATFATLFSAPTITTDPVTSPSNVNAILNCTVNPNSLACRVRWGYQITSDAGAGAWTNYTAYQNVSGSGNQALSVSIAGLIASSPYFFRAFVEYPSPGFANLVQGSPSQTFNTTADPLVTAAGDDMLPIQDFDRKYGVSTTLYFVVQSPAATPNTFYTGAAVWAGAGESKISKDGGAFVDTTNDPAQVGTQLYSLVLTAAELQCDQAFIILTDTGAAARDLILRVRTAQLLGSVDIDSAAGSKANSTAFKVTGFGSGHGLQAVAGATGNDIDGVIAQHFGRVSIATAGGASTVTLDAGAVATPNYYNGFAAVIVAGTGVGQARIITSYDAARIATVDSSWVTNPAAGSKILLYPSSRAFSTAPSAELAAIPGPTASYGAMLQLIFQRFAFKITQNATVQTLFKSGAGGALGTRSVSDDGVTQTIGQLA